MWASPAAGIAGNAAVAVAGPEAQEVDDLKKASFRSMWSKCQSVAVEIAEG